MTLADAPRTVTGTDTSVTNFGNELGLYRLHRQVPERITAMKGRAAARRDEIIAMLEAEYRAARVGGEEPPSAARPRFVVVQAKWGARDLNPWRAARAAAAVHVTDAPEATHLIADAQEWPAKNNSPKNFSKSQGQRDWNEGVFALVFRVTLPNIIANIRSAGLCGRDPALHPLVRRISEVSRCYPIGVGETPLEARGGSIAWGGRGLCRPMCPVAR